MKVGILKVLIIFFMFFLPLAAEDKILTVPLVNLDNLKPSYEEVDLEDSTEKKKKLLELKKKNKKTPKSKNITVNILGLDKITAKTTEINIKIGEQKKFGLLEIKALKCGKVDSSNERGEAAYIQVKDLTDNMNEKVFVFNGWTFSSSHSLRPLDHPVYDLWLVGCENV